MHRVPMTKNTGSNSPSNTAEDTPEREGAPDPRPGFAQVVAALHPLIAAAETQTDRATPCSDFTVKELLEHLVMVMRRTTAIGTGEHWSTVEEEPTDSGWGDQFQAAAAESENAWSDPAKLAGTYEVPWGDIPGTPLLFTYTAELAVHGWDLATATDQDFSIDDEVLAGPLMAARFIPAEGRGEEMPFDPVVDPGPDAPVLLQIAGWMGRQVV